MLPSSLLKSAGCRSLSRLPSAWVRVGSDAELFQKRTAICPLHKSSPTGSLGGGMPVVLGGRWLGQGQSSAYDRGPTPPPDFLTIFLCCMELGRSGCRKFVSALSLSPKIVQAKELRAVCASFLVQSQ